MHLLKKFGFSVILLTAFILINCKKNSGCNRQLHEYTAYGGNYTQCVLNHATPTSMCGGCVDQYWGLQTCYENLLHANDTVNHTECKELYLDRDQLNMISNSYEYFVKLWDNAHCENCFNGSKTAFTLETTQMINNINEWNTCMTSSGKECCTKCDEIYKKTSDQYDNYSHEYNNQVCFDVLDTHNRTLHRWTDEMKCQKKKIVASLHTFYIVSSVFAFLPILFYVGVVAYTLRMEGNYSILRTDTEREIEPDDNTDNDNPATIDDDNVSTVASNFSYDVGPSGNYNFTTDDNMIGGSTCPVYSEDDTVSSLKKGQLEIQKNSKKSSISSSTDD